MSTCPFCSEEIAADSAECPSCGRELPGPSLANVGDAPPVQPSKSNAKKWILIGGAGCGFCVLILACLAAFLLPMVSKARDAARELAAEAAARNEQQVQDSDEQLMEMDTLSSEDDSGSGGGLMPPATTAPRAQAAAADPVATLKNLGAVIKRNDQGEVVTVSFDTPLVAFGNKEITDTVLVHIKELTNLQTLDLPKQITDAGLVHLKGLTRLQTLDLLSTQITDAGLVHLKGLTKLQSLDLPEQITDAGVADLQKALPNCKILKYK